MVENVIETTALNKRFGRKLALRNLSLQVPWGGIHAVVGSNGAGKTTLFRILLGILSPSSGESRILGTDSRTLTPRIRGRIGFVTEEHTLPGWMEVASLVEMQRCLYPAWNEKVYRDVVGHFHVATEQKVSQLSRGERAGLSLAMALAQSPELLILDEPTLGLDVVAKQATLESILFVGESEECTIVYCSHQMDEIERVADNLILLERGELMNMSPLEEFCARISYWTADTLPPGGSRNVPGLLQARVLDGQHHLVVMDQEEIFPFYLEGIGATGVHRLPIGFDRAVNAYLSRTHASPSN